MPGHHPSGTHLALSAFPVLGKVQLSETHLFVILLLLRNRILLTSSMAMKCSFITLNLVRAGIRACCKLSAQSCGNIRTTVMPAVQVFCDANPSSWTPAAGHRASAVAGHPVISAVCIGGRVCGCQGDRKRRRRGTNLHWEA